MSQTTIWWIWISVYRIRRSLVAQQAVEVLVEGHDQGLHARSRVTQC